jgi:hypothetical protein
MASPPNASRRDTLIFMSKEEMQALADVYMQARTKYAEAYENAALEKSKLAAASSRASSAVKSLGYTGDPGVPNLAKLGHEQVLKAAAAESVYLKAKADFDEAEQLLIEAKTRVAETWENLVAASSSSG